MFLLTGGESVGSGVLTGRDVYADSDGMISNDDFSPMTDAQQCLERETATPYGVNPIQTEREEYRLRVKRYTYTDWEMCCLGSGGCADSWYEICGPDQNMVC